MPKRKRPPIIPTEDRAQLRPLLTQPEQEAYELIRSVVLFGRSSGRRAKESRMRINPYQVRRRAKGTGSPSANLTKVSYVGATARVLFFDRKPAGERPWTEQLWLYDLRTNKEFSLKQKPLTREDLDEFVACFNPQHRHDRRPTWSESNPQGRWRAYPYDELLARDKVSLDIFWLRDESLEDSATLPDPDILAAEIIQDLQAALEQFAAIAEDLEG